MMSPRPIPPLLLAVFSGTGALAGALILATALGRAAASGSHALPEAGRNFITAAEINPALVHRGAGLFLNSCAHCHGSDARGDEGPDLHDLQVSDRRIATVIRVGIKGEMPSFARKHGQPDIHALIAYLRTLQ